MLQLMKTPSNRTLATIGYNGKPRLSKLVIIVAGGVKFLDGW